MVNKHKKCACEAKAKRGRPKNKVVIERLKKEIDSLTALVNNYREKYPEALAAVREAREARDEARREHAALLGNIKKIIVHYEQQNESVPF